MSTLVARRLDMVLSRINELEEDLYDIEVILSDDSFEGFFDDAFDSLSHLHRAVTDRQAQNDNDEQTTFDFGDVQ